MGNRKALGVKYLLLGGLLFWISLVSGFYFFYHQNEVKKAVLALSSWLFDISLAIIIVTLAALWGDQLGRFLRVRYHSGWERLAFSAGLGYGLLATLVLLLGLSGLLYRWLLWLIVVLLAAAVWKEIKGLAPQCKRWWTRIAKGLSFHPDFQTLLLFFLGANLLLAIFLASAPPTDWDALVIHLVIPKVALREHGLSQPLEVPDLFSQKPLLEHMLFTLGMALRGDRIAKLIAFSFSLLTVGAIYAFGKRFCGPRVALLAVTIFSSIPVVVLISTFAYVDLGVTFYSFAALYALINWIQTEERGWLAISAIFGGLSPQVKNNGLFTLVVLGVGVFYAILRYRSRWKELVRSLSLFAVVMALTLLPWVVASLTLSGAPTPAWEQMQSKATPPSASLTELLLSLLRRVAIPWEMTIVGAQGKVAYDATITPLFLLLLPLWFVMKRKGEAINLLIVFSLVEFILWVANPVGPRLQSRLAMPIFPALSIISAYLFERLPELETPTFSLYGFSRLVLFLTLALHLIAQVSMAAFYDPWRYLLGQESRQEYLARILDEGISSDYYTAMSYLNDHLPPEARVGILWPEPRVYYCERAWVLSPLHLDDSPSEMLARLQEKGVTHLLVSKKGQEFYLYEEEASPETRDRRREYVKNLETLLSHHAYLVHNQGDSFLIYALADG
jgi:4-amino-4-deoxy-L-arabinose transferase-like glycosyltransferase